MIVRSLLITLLCSFASITYTQDTLLLFHPTVYNISLMEKLHEDGILELEDYHVLGVYHSLEAYDYKASIRKLQDEPDSYFSLKEIGEELEAGMLFGNNPCSSLFKALFHSSEGALFMGGPDIPPGLYGEEVHLLSSVTDPYRHYLEASFIFHLLGGSQDSQWTPWLNERNDYLISGICLGMQTMNVATGGTMIQDIPTELYGKWTAETLLNMEADQLHRSYKGMVEPTCESPTSYHFHRVRLTDESFLKTKLNYLDQSHPLVLSSHHQAIQEPGLGWKISATSMDGKIIEAIQHEAFPHVFGKISATSMDGKIIEAIQHEAFPHVFGVQFHPEKPGLFDPGILHPLSCKKEISFYEQIRNTDSFSFHKKYWKHIEEILKGDK